MSRSSLLREERKKQIDMFETMVEKVEKRRAGVVDVEEDGDWTKVHMGGASEDSGGFRSQRLSDEETLAMLEEAGSTISLKDGPRRSRYLKREKNRWRAVRKLDKHKKIERMHANIRKDMKRKRKVKEVKQVLATAEEVRQRDAEYREMVMAATIGANS